MAYAHSPPGLTAQHRSQSDSNLLTSKQDLNGSVFRTSMDDMDVDTGDAQKRNRSFFYRLVRPWKWGRRFKKKGKQGGGASRPMYTIISKPVSRRAT